MTSPADRRRIPPRAALLWGAFCVLAATAASAGSRWDFPVSTGYDLYVHDYFLSESDTTEVIQEFNLAASANGASEWGARHRWFFRAGLSGGTELFRESLESGIQLRTTEDEEWLRADFLLLSRQFRDDSEYSLSSNATEGRLFTALSPWTGDDMAIELRARGRFVEYADPSTLEVSYQDGSAGAYLRSPGHQFRRWNIGGRYSARAYPDSAAIDREGYVLEGEYDHGALDGEFRAFHRSERRNIADETARPSAWFHWTDLNSAIPADQAEVILRASSEVWDYDEATGAWYDSRLVGGQAGGRWGDPLRARFECLVTAELLDAGDEPESYAQGGIRIGADSMGSRFSGSASVEVGRRWYRDDPASDDEFVLRYSDYTYVALWVMANWMISEHFAVDATLNFEPESHTEQDDDIALGFASLRLVWRP